MDGSDDGYRDVLAPVFGTGRPPRRVATTSERNALIMLAVRRGDGDHVGDFGFGGLARYDDRSREVAGDVERGAAHVEEAVDAEDDADALGWNADDAADHRDDGQGAGRH